MAAVVIILAASMNVRLPLRKAGYEELPHADREDGET